MGCLILLFYPSPSSASPKPANARAVILLKKAIDLFFARRADSEEASTPQVESTTQKMPSIVKISVRKCEKSTQRKLSPLDLLSLRQSPLERECPASHTCNSFGHNTSPQFIFVL